MTIVHITASNGVVISKGIRPGVGPFLRFGPGPLGAGELVA